MTKGLRDTGTASQRLTADTTMAELIEGWPAARVVLARRGMACVGCAMGPFETVAEVADAYGFDPGDFLREIAAEADPARPGRSRLRRRKDAGSNPRHHSRQRRSSS
jgi:hybrid cluster-associated redox disulfide protein